MTQYNLCTAHNAIHTYIYIFLMSKDAVPMVTYKLQQSIRSKLFNHEKFVELFNINTFIQNATILSCHCENSPFNDPEHGHILIGDLWIVRYNKLRKLITKGHKYRETLAICGNKAESYTTVFLMEKCDSKPHRFSGQQIQE